MNLDDIWLVFKTLGVEACYYSYYMSGGNQLSIGFAGGLFSVLPCILIWLVWALFYDDAEAFLSRHWKKIFIIPLCFFVYGGFGAAKLVSQKAAQIREKPEAAHFITKTEQN